MKPAVPIDQVPKPFITFYTPTFRRPSGLARNMASVGKQTAHLHIEQLVVPDHVGLGVVGGLFGRIPWYAEACRGQYVHVLADDDMLAGETVVAQVMKFAEKRKYPPVILVRTVKNGFEFPIVYPPNEIEPGDVDMTCYILRRDVWLRHCRDYGDRYEGDFDHAWVLYKAGYEQAVLDLQFVEGGASNGRPEGDWA